MTAVLNRWERSGVRGIDRLQIKIRGGQQQTASRFQTSSNVAHKFAVINDVFDDLAANREIKSTYEVAPAVQPSHILDLKFCGGRIAHFGALRRDGLIPGIPAQAERAIPSQGGSNSKSPAPAPNVNQVFRAIITREPPT